MGPDQFPMFRLATLLARQLSSPIASRIKSYATTHPVFRRTLIVTTGRAYRTAELRFKMWMLRLGRPARSPPLSEHDATQVGADIIGEMIIFSLGAAIIVYEVNRQAVNKELKELDERSHWVAILVGLEELQREVELQQEDLDRLYEALRELAPNLLPTRPSSKPPIVKIPDHPPQATSPVPDSVPVSSPKTPHAPPQVTSSDSSSDSTPKIPDPPPSATRHGSKSICLPRIRNPPPSPKTPDPAAQGTQQGMGSICLPKIRNPPTQAKPHGSNSISPPKIPDPPPQATPHGSNSVVPRKAPEPALKSKAETPPAPTTAPMKPDSAPQDLQTEELVAPTPTAPKKHRYCLPKS